MIWEPLTPALSESQMRSDAVSKALEASQQGLNLAIDSQATHISKAKAPAKTDPM